MLMRFSRVTSLPNRASDLRRLERALVLPRGRTSPLSKRRDGLGRRFGYPDLRTGVLR